MTARAPFSASSTCDCHSGGAKGTVIISGTASHSYPKLQISGFSIRKGTGDLFVATKPAIHYVRIYFRRQVKKRKIESLVTKQPSVFQQTSLPLCCFYSLFTLWMSCQRSLFIKLPICPLGNSSCLYFALVLHTYISTLCRNVREYLQ